MLQSFFDKEGAMRSNMIAHGLFLVLVAMAWLAMFWAVRRNKPFCRQLLWISALSFPGGLLVGAWHRNDFWNPPSWLGYPVIRPVFTLEDALFGFFFAGFVSVLVPFQTGRHLQDQPVPRRVTRRRKVGGLISTVATAGLLFLLPLMNSVVACSWVFLLSTLIICYRRPDLCHVAISGVLPTLMAYALLIGMLLALVSNRLELAQSICQFYVRHGMLWTGGVLMLWAMTFGAWSSVLYPFVTNKRFVVYLRQMAR